MIVQTKVAATTTTVTDTLFELNHNPNSKKVMFFIGAITSGTAKQIDGRMHPEAAWTSLAFPTANANTYTQVDICPEYRIRTQTSGANQNITIILGN